MFYMCDEKYVAARTHTNGSLVVTYRNNEPVFHGNLVRFPTLLAYTPDDGGRIIEYTRTTGDAEHALELAKDGHILLGKFTPGFTLRCTRGYYPQSAWIGKLPETEKEKFVKALSRHGLTIETVRDFKTRCKIGHSPFNLGPRHQMDVKERLNYATQGDNYSEPRREVRLPLRCDPPVPSRMG